MMFNFKEKKFKNKERIKMVIIIIVIIVIICIAAVDVNKHNVISAKIEYSNTKEVISLASIVQQNDYVVQRINEEYRKSNIEIYYPVTEYSKLNLEIKSIIDKTIIEFKEHIIDDLEYSLLINFDVYKYNNYIGVLFHVLEDDLGAHPKSYIFTINYNTKKDSIINIDNLINENNNILNLMAKYSYSVLNENQKIKDINMPYMLENGTNPQKNNYNKFIFDKDGLIVFFDEYQIAPYAYGTFNVIIPYTELNLNIID